MRRRRLWVRWGLGLSGLAAATVWVAAARSTSAGQDRPCGLDGVSGQVDCGALSVPEDRTTSGGRRIDISYVVLRASRPTNEPPVFRFAGGPGAGSVGLARSAGRLVRSILADRDIVLADQRGTGRSNPLACPSDVASSPVSAFGHVFDAGEIRQCRETLAERANLSLYTTAHAIQDIDEIRAHLGYERVLLWGGSYGTRVAQAYTRRHPERVVAMVLDGVVPFGITIPGTYAASAQQSLDRVFAACRDEPSCRASHPNLDEQFAQLERRLTGGPMPATVRTDDNSPVSVAMSLGDFGYALRGILYGASAVRELPALIDNAARSGDLSGFAQRYWERAVGLSGRVAVGMHLSVLCPEDVDLIRDADLPALVDGSFLDRYLIDSYRGACDVWNVAPIDPAFNEPLSTDVPTLLLSGFYDPVTPPAFGELVARTLTNSRHIVVADGGHGVANRCAGPAVLQVLTTGSLDGLPPVCAAG
jgi:pimeloyl-ACP methyl ester carboxylesterase